MQQNNAYDTCHYVVKAGADAGAGFPSLGSFITLFEPYSVKLIFRLNKKENMNVFIYEGTSRETATKQIVHGNEQPELHRDYTVNKDSGILIVAYPTDPDQEGASTSLDFEYYLGYPSTASDQS